MATRALGRTAPPESRHVPEPIVGQRLGRYELLMLLAVGGMAQVWLGRQSGALGFSKIVAIKIIRPEIAADPDARAMFLDEARLSASIRHANVVETSDLGEEDGLVYQVMTFVEGGALSTLLSRTRGPTPIGPVLRIATDFLRGLDAAHEARDESGARLGLVHRDVSPQNVLVGIDGVAKLSDFGIAKAALGRVSNETKTGAVKGKIRYMAPEQLRAQRPTPSTDIYAAGVVLWEALAGRALFPMRVALEKAERDRRVVPSLRSIRDDVPEAIDAIVTRALSLSPADRFASAREMAEAIEGAAEQARISLSHQDVASFVKETIGADLERLQSLLRAASGRGSAPPPSADANPPSKLTAETTTVAIAPASDAPRPRRSRWLATAVVTGIVAASVTFLALLVGDASRITERASLGAVTKPSDPPPVAPLASAPVESARAATAPPTAAAPPPAVTATPHAPSGRATATPARRAAKTPATTSPTTSRPTFDNPYK